MSKYQSKMIPVVACNSSNYLSFIFHFTAPAGWSTCCVYMKGKINEYFQDKFGFRSQIMNLFSLSSPCLWQRSKSHHTDFPVMRPFGRQQQGIFPSWKHRQQRKSSVDDWASFRSAHCNCADWNIAKSFNTGRGGMSSKVEWRILTPCFRKSRSYSFDFCASREMGFHDHSTELQTFKRCSALLPSVSQVFLSIFPTKSEAPGHVCPLWRE